MNWFCRVLGEKKNVKSTIFSPLKLFTCFHADCARLQRHSGASNSPNSNLAPQFLRLSSAREGSRTRNVSLHSGVSPCQQKPKGALLYNDELLFLFYPLPGTSCYGSRKKFPQWSLPLSVNSLRQIVPTLSPLIFRSEISSYSPTATRMSFATQLLHSSQVCNCRRISVLFYCPFQSTRGPLRHFFAPRDSIHPTFF